MEKKVAPINVVIVALNEKFCKEVATSLADKLDMFLADCHELIVYDLIDPKDVIDKCGVEYFKKRERGVVKNCAGFYNTVISINYDLLREYQDLFTNSIIFYVKLEKDKVKDVPNVVAYENRDQNLQAITKKNVVELNNRSVAQAIKKIMIKLGEIYENC